MSGPIVTFYSYKGGVGRSMALANVAVLLARRGLKVLVVDWDLEAPGLERYFGYFETSVGGPGLLRMLVEVRDRGSADFWDFTSLIHCEAEHPITFLASGREQDDSYSRCLETFEWREFFAKGGGAFIERLRDEWREAFDIVVIDSRTGLSDAGGICTIQMPDIVVAMFTANYQSLYGVRDVMRLAQQARQHLAYDRMPLSVLPLPARWGVQEFKETQIWLDRIVEGVQEFFEDWLPRPLQARQVLESIKIPQSSYFGFGERLAVVEQGTTDPTGMGFVYDRIASFLASGFQDVSTLVGDEAYRNIDAHSPATVEQGTERPDESGYAFDIFVSYDRTVVEWVHEFIVDLRQALDLISGRPIRFFLDTRELDLGASLGDQIHDALVRSKVLLAVLTPRYEVREWTMRELEHFSDREAATKKPVIFPVLLRGHGLPAPFRDQLFVDMRKFSLRPSHQRSLEWSHAVFSLADQLRHAITQAPPFDPAWLETER